MTTRDAAGVAALLAEMGRRAMLSGGNPYRAKAYLRAADSLAALTEDLRDVIEEGRLREIPGVGEAIAAIIADLHRMGTHPSLERLRQETPDEVAELLTIPGLHPDKARKLYEALGIRSVAELESAARDNKLAMVKGLGASLQRKLLDTIESQREAGRARHIHRAAELLQHAERTFKRRNPQLKRVTIAGDLRRGADLVSDLALVAEAPGLTAPEVLQTGDIAVHLAAKEHYAATLLHATGSAAHLEALRARAKAKGFTLTPSGLLRGDAPVPAQSEAEIYRLLGLQFIEPELREGRGEIELAAKKRLGKLVSETDIKGILHAHTRASDGVNTLEQMAEATRKRGYQYFGIADHSKSAHYAGGLSLEEIETQHAEIDALNAHYGSGFHILKGIESDILSDGALDYPDDILGTFDFIVASVHGQFRKDRAAQTDRILQAVANPYTTILGHMTGRQLLRRPGYEVDVEKILKACAKHQVAVEINANPWRLDLDWRWHGRALALGCVFSINPDAHSTSEIDLVRWGVSMARKGGVPPERVVNCLSLPEFSRWLRRRSEGAKPSPRRKKTSAGRPKASARL